jgi:ubiquinone/menaquinone biosynthesis C-methylase UbiE
MRWFGWFRKKKTAADEQSMMATIGGRTFTRGIPYALPRDLEEMNRLDFQHFLLRQAFKGNYAAPIGNPGSILDVGAGTGRWAREMALLFPQAQVVGIDVNVPPVDEAASGGAASEPLPPNYRFVAGNIFEGLPFPDASFDFVHMRLLVLAIPHDKWPFVVGELARVTRIGGWVESVEATTLEQGGPAMDLIMEWIVTMLARRGIVFADGAKVGTLLQEAGLVNVQAHKITLPFGEYGGRVGKLLATDFFNGARSYGGLLEAQGLATVAQYNEAMEQAARDTASPQVHCLSPFHIAFGQRT